jgi:hypothetical protein
MNKKNLPESKADKVQPSGSKVRLSNAQLLNVIEFSRQFPELTQHLAVVREGDEEASYLRLEKKGNEPLEFPPLVAPNPREIKPRASDKSDEVSEHDASDDDEFALFAAGRLPPPEPAETLDDQKKKKKFWKLLLPLTLFMLFLFWLHEAASPVRPVNNTQQRKLQASR